MTLVVSVIVTWLRLQVHRIRHQEHAISALQADGWRGSRCVQLGVEQALLKIKASEFLLAFTQRCSWCRRCSSTLDHRYRPLAFHASSAPTLQDPTCSMHLQARKCDAGHLHLHPPTPRVPPSSLSPGAVRRVRRV